MSPEAGTEMAPTPSDAHFDRTKATVWAAVALYILGSAYSISALYRRLDVLEHSQAEIQKRSDEAIALLGSRLKADESASQTCPRRGSSSITGTATCAGVVTTRPSAVIT